MLLDVSSSRGNRSGSGDLRDVVGIVCYLTETPEGSAIICGAAEAITASEGPIHGASFVLKLAAMTISLYKTMKINKACTSRIIKIYEFD